MLLELGVKNFKSLLDVELPLEKLNLFIGPNNAGKSSILQLLILLKQFQHASNPYQGSYFYFENYKETVSHRNESARIGVRITKQLSDPEAKILWSTIPSGLREYLLGNYPRILKHELRGSFVSYKLQIGPEGLEAQTISIDDLKLYSASIDKEIYYVLSQPKLSNFRSPSNLFGHTWSGPSSSGLDPTKFINEMSQIMSKWLENVQFLPVTRGIVDWKYHIDGVMPKSLHPKDRGHSTANILLYLNNEDHKHLREKIIKWTEFFGLEGINSHVVEGPSCVIDAKDPELAVTVNIVGAGFGVGQILPVIVESFRAPVNSTILIEEPEIHLHPASQVKLIDLFLEIIQEGKQLFVTTHSEHLLLRLQTRVAEGKISPKDVVIHYVTKDKNGTQVQPVEIYKDGTIAKGLPGFSDINERELHYWLEAIKKRE